LCRSGRAAGRSSGRTCAPRRGPARRGRPCGPSGRCAVPERLIMSRLSRALAVVLVAAERAVEPVGAGGPAVLCSRPVWACVGGSFDSGVCQLLWPPARPALSIVFLDPPSAPRAQLGAHPLFRRLAALGEHRVFARGKEVADDLRERWETSDSPLVQRIQARGRLRLVTHVRVRVQCIGLGRALPRGAAAHQRRAHARACREGGPCPDVYTCGAAGRRPVRARAPPRAGAARRAVRARGRLWRRAL